MKNYEIFKRNEYYPIIINEKEYLINREPYLDIVITDNCNRKCKFCIADLLEKKEEIDIDVFKKQIDFAINNFNVKEVLIVGGEPTIAKNIYPIIHYLHELRMRKKLNKICLTTNGDAISNENYRKSILPYITHINISLMCIKEESQKEIAGSNRSLSKHEIRDICMDCRNYNAKLRLNANIFRGNLDNLDSVIEYYNEFKYVCDSIKFSPLLKVDDFSVVNKVIDFVKENILSDLEYESLFKSIEKYYIDEPIVRNPLTFGFVEYSMICLDTPIILNYNHRGQMATKAKEGKINNIKLLTNGTLSLSWNKDDISKIIRENNYEKAN